MGQPKSITTNQIYGRLNLTLIRANSRAILSRGLGLHLDAPVHEVAIKWWLGMDTSQGSQCALCPGNALNLWDIMPPLVSVAVMWWYDTTPFVMFWLKHATGPILASKWKLAMTPQPIIYSHTHPADLLLTNWTTGKTAAFDISAQHTYPYGSGSVFWISCPCQ
ncbi:hypothetical protein EMCRGX_G030423 [Ephydatia muelleri]